MYIRRFSGQFGSSIPLILRVERSGVIRCNLARIVANSLQGINQVAGNQSISNNRGLSLLGYHLLYRGGLLVGY